MLDKDCIMSIYGSIIPGEMSALTYNPKFIEGDAPTKCDEGG